MVNRGVDRFDFDFIYAMVMNVNMICGDDNGTMGYGQNS
ncbi:hypothetical protein PAUR_b0763 [Pseudoalteromonas aurantia 208]|uniref:Uncharacterized protein n=1 Tax=Pseudoalteromonas aurantia 208 TaxID=1314867 RepID=A0ABR9ELT2_9GAMM|nr:hypothetical protein [Pseudoalteromonas aurantia 208]